MINVKKGIEMNKLKIKAPTGNKLICKGWHQEAAYRMIQNNLDSSVAEDPANLIVYGGLGKAARNWDCYNQILESLIELENDETLLIQSGKPIAILKTGSRQLQFVKINTSDFKYFAMKEGGIYELDDQYEYRYKKKVSVFFYNFSNSKPISSSPEAKNIIIFPNFLLGQKISPETKVIQK